MIPFPSSSDSDSCHRLDDIYESHSCVDYRMFNLEKYVKDYPCLYYSVIKAGYMCKNVKCFLYCLLLLEFINEPVKSLTNHPRHFLSSHQNSNKHQTAMKQYEGKIF